MADAAVQSDIEARLSELHEALDAGDLERTRALLGELHPAEIASFIESLPHTEREQVWELVDEDLQGEVLAHLGDEVRASLIEDMGTDEIIAATEGLDVDDLADIVQNLPEQEISQILQSLDEQNRHRLETILSYDEDTAGGLMNTDAITVRPDVDLDVVTRYLRLRRELPEHTDSLFVVDRDDHYLGVLPLADILTHDPEEPVEKVYNRQVHGIPASTPANEVATLFEHHDLMSAPVVDDQGKLLGRITVDDVVDYIRDEADHAVMSQAGLNEEDDIFAPVLPSAKTRAVWLGINLITALMAAWVIGLFQGTLEKIVALAVLMPIVASMGGIAGTQTLTIVIRGLALGQVSRHNLRWLFNKEVMVGLLNGILWALVIAAIATLWFKDPQIGMVIAIAMIINLIIAAIAGVIIPIVLKKMHIDPALAGGVVLTTVTDMMGFFVFLGLATVLLVKN
ncbi:MAG: magnesium transporter [Gammaproteobacteria bacterium]|nr:MAG: magnesium transporter [Gammaproteobacteria bacterium]